MVLQITTGDSAITDQKLVHGTLVVNMGSNFVKKTVAVTVTNDILIIFRTKFTLYYFRR